MNRQNTGALPITDYINQQEFTIHTGNTVIHFSGHTFTQDGAVVITQVGDNVKIYAPAATGTLTARFANELAANTNIVVQKGSWGWWF
jgi:hypothetical protein